VKPLADLKFKIAAEPWELEQVARLNYKTFVEEIPQHAPNPDRTLIDRFNEENTYIICLRDRKLLGMIAVRDRRPFSLDHKFQDLDAYLPAARKICEVRLLSVEKEYRNGRIFLGLARLLEQTCIHQGYDLVVISGALKQQRLYEHLGFVPFGPLVGDEISPFQPMYLTVEKYRTLTQNLLLSLGRVASLRRRRNFLPGPVEVSSEVRRSFAGYPVSHRSDAFVADFQKTKRLLCRLANAKHVEIFLGSGTLANDVVAAQLSLHRGPGLILNNGEFGGRLIEHARAFRLEFDPYAVKWGEIFKREAVERILDRSSEIRWLWAVHCETSTGVLNDLEMLKAVCSARGILLCVDCISSIGTTPVNLKGVYLASGVSGKGLGAYPGLSMVFYHHRARPEPNRIPRYLDLGAYAANQGVPFTSSSNLLYALRSALTGLESEQRFRELREHAAWLRERLHDLGLEILAPEDHGSPAVVTIVLPQNSSSRDIGAKLDQEGYLLSYKSRYLLERNLIQICLMGNHSEKDLPSLLSILARCVLTPTAFGADKELKEAG